MSAGPSGQALPALSPSLLPAGGGGDGEVPVRGEPRFSSGTGGAFRARAGQGRARVAAQPRAPLGDPAVPGERRHLRPLPGDVTPHIT